jgi:hypothetical protein
MIKPDEQSENEEASSSNEEAPAIVQSVED